MDNLGIPLDSEVIRAKKILTCDLKDASASKSILLAVPFMDLRETKFKDEKLMHTLNSLLKTC